MVVSVRVETWTQWQLSLVFSMRLPMIPFVTLITTTEAQEFAIRATITPIYQ